MARNPTIREAYKRLWPYLRRHRGKGIAIIFLGAFASLGARLNLVLLKPLVDLVLPLSLAAPVEEQGEAAPLDQLTTETIKPFFDGLSLFGLGEKPSAIVLLVGVMLASAVIFSVVQYFFVRLARMLGVYMVTDLRQDMAEHILKLGMQYHSGRRLGDLISRLTADVATSLRILNLVVEELVQEPFTILFSLCLAWYAAPTATLAILAFLPLLALPVLKLGPKVRRRSQRSLAKLGDTTQNLAQMFSGIRVVKAFRMEARESQEFRRANDEFVHQTKRMVKAQAASLATTAFLAQAAIAVALGGVALVSIFGGTLFASSGSMAVFIGAILPLFSGVKRLTKALTVIHASLGATTRVFEVLDLKPEIVETGREVPFKGLQRDIRFEKVGFQYGGGDGDVLKEVDFTVKRGERIALVGASGAGKSTLLDLVARFYDPTAGRITVDGKDLRDLKLADWLDHLALVGQHPFLFQTTLYENIRYGRPEAKPEEIEAAVRASYLEKFVASLPTGLHTQVGESGARLSGGQAQRVTIARAILRNPEVLLLDEATSALDSESERMVQEALENLMKGRTSFVIAHRLSTIQNCDRIFVMDHGRVLEEGRHDELLQSDGLYARMWKMQSHGALI